MPKIMIIDDDKEWSKDISEYLQSEGFEVIIKANSDEGISLFNQEPFDVLVIDYKLLNGGTNKDNGVDVINKIRSYDKFIPIILCSGQLEKSGDVEKILIDSIRLGIADYFNKSKSAKELQVVIKKCQDIKTDSIISAYEKWYQKCVDKDAPVIVNSNGEKYSPKRIIEEIKKGTPLGVELRKDLAEFAIEVLN
jgi:two-component system response regulator HydG